MTYDFHITYTAYKFIREHTQAYIIYKYLYIKYLKHAQICKGKHNNTKRLETSLTTLQPSESGTCAAETKGLPTGAA